MPSPKSKSYDMMFPSGSEEPDPSTEHSNPSQEPCRAAVGTVFGPITFSTAVAVDTAPRSSVTVKVTV